MTYVSTSQLVSQRIDLIHQALAAPGTTRATFVTLAATYTPPVNTVVFMAGYGYRYIGSGTAISDLPGWVPIGAVPQHWGAVADGVTNDAVAVQAWADYGDLEHPTLRGEFGILSPISFNVVRRKITGLHLIALAGWVNGTYMVQLDGNIGMFLNNVLRCQDLAEGIKVTNARGSWVSHNRIEKPKAYGIRGEGDWTDGQVRGNHIANYNAAAKVATGIYTESDDIYITDNILQLMLVGVDAPGYGVHIEGNHIYQGNGGGVETTVMSCGIKVEGDHLTIRGNYMDKCFVWLVNGVFRAATANRRSVSIEDNDFYQNANYATIDAFIQFDRNGGVTSVFSQIVVRNNRVRNNNTSTGLRLLMGVGAGAYSVSRNVFAGNNGNINMGQDSINLVSDGGYALLTGDYTMSNSGAQQQIFNRAGAGSLYLDTGVYRFTTMIGIQVMSATSGNGQFDLLGAGTATLATIFYHAVGEDQNSPVSTSAQNGSFSWTAASVAPILAAGVNTGIGVTITGTLIVSTAGTIIPSFALTTAIGTATMKAGTSLRVDKIGESDVTQSGMWA